MITASELAEALTPAFAEVVVPGARRPALGLEVVEPGCATVLDAGDMVVGIGLRDADDALALAEKAQAAAGLLLRRPWTQHPAVREACAGFGLPLLAVAEEASWSSLLRLLRRSLDSVVTAGHPQGPGDHVHSDLFDMADTISAILDAPVTIEDPTSRVLAYSTGQHDVDAARMSTIFGRQVPRELRDRFRSLGVFRRLAQSDEPFLVPAGEGLLKSRYIVPVRAGGEWLGSVWAVVDGPVPADRAGELKAAADVVALYLLRLRAQGELHRQVQLDQVRTVLRGNGSERPRWLGDGPWRVAALGGPEPGLGAAARCELWLALARRHGWRQPLIADLDDAVYVVLAADGTEPGSWAWFGDVVRRESRTGPQTRMVGGGRVHRVADLAGSRGQADDLGRLDPQHLDHPVAAIESAWAAMVLARAVSGLAGRPALSPLAALLDHEDRHGGRLVPTLQAVIDYWGEPQRAARALGVHPNTIRYRMARIAELCPADLTDPAQRLAIRLELAARPPGAPRPPGDR